MNHRHLVILGVLAATLAACGTAPQRNDALEQARSRFGGASNDPQVSTLAPDELRRAGQSLQVAERAWSDGGTLTTVDHLAYLALQRVTLAQETAWSRAAQAVTAGAGAERDRMRLEQRTGEADAAARQLAASQRSNVRQSAELAEAEAAAQRDQARIERRDMRVSDLEAQLKDLNARKTDRGIVVTLGDVLFDTGQARLLPEGTRNMIKLADVFRQDPRRRASVEGYTDSTGNADANVALSARRAMAVRTALVDLGVSPDRLSTQAHGASHPAASNATAAGRQMNRRVEIVFAPQAGDVSLR